MITKHLLTKYQREQGLRTIESVDFIILVDTKIPQAQLYDEPEYHQVAVFSTSGMKIEELQRTANDYIIEMNNTNKALSAN